MEGQDVVGSDDHKLGHVVAERDDCVIVEMGHVFKSKHAIPRQFLHEHDGELRATVTKDVVSDSPKVDLDHWDPRAIRLHYGLEGTFETNPDPDGLESAETAGAREGVTPAPAERLETLGGANDLPQEAIEKLINIREKAGYLKENARCQACGYLHDAGIACDLDVTYPAAAGSNGKKISFTREELIELLSQAAKLG